MNNENPSFCIKCGNVHIVSKIDTEKTCSKCNHIMYFNPAPVAVVLIPIKFRKEYGILLIQRAIEPQVGGWAFPGGYVNLGESPQDAAIREVKEETNLSITIKRPLNIHSSASRHSIQLFFEADALTDKEVYETIKLSNECLAYSIIFCSEKLCFETHKKVLDEYLSNNFNHLKQRVSENG